MLDLPLPLRPAPPINTTWTGIGTCTCDRIEILVKASDDSACRVRLEAIEDELADVHFTLRALSCWCGCAVGLVFSLAQPVVTVIFFFWR